MSRPDAGFSGAVSGLNTLGLCAEGDTAVHRLHPLIKLTVTIVYTVAVISFGRYQILHLLPYFFYPAILAPLSETPFRLLLQRLLPALPFSLFGGLGNVFFDRVPMVMLGGFVMTGGMVSFVSIMIKTILSVSAILLLVSTTSMADLSKQMAALGVPNAFVLQMILTYRYLSVLIDETCAMYTSYMLRSPGARGVHMRDMGMFVGNLLLRSINRAEQVYSAMKCRGFSGVYPTPPHGHPSAYDLFYMFVVCGAAILLRCF
jgi:cobalt/nickel transport system permease protein